MSTYLLVHGGWHGGWAFRALARLLTQDGHEVYRPTLAGLAERSWETRLGVNIDTHVAELRALIDWEDLDNVILVAHSYGGFVATALADASPEWFRALIYLDAFVPEDGEAPFDLVPRAVSLLKDTAADNGLTMTLPSSASLGVNACHQQRLSNYPICHPLGSFHQRVRLTGRYREVPRKAFIIAEKDDGAGTSSPFRRYHRAAADNPEWDTFALVGSHNLMLDDPAGLASILRRYADPIEESRSNGV